jgi:hypothetical protein
MNVIHLNLAQKILSALYIWALVFVIYILYDTSLQNMYLLEVYYIHSIM